MDRGHSRLVVILLAAILFVLLFGRDAAIFAFGGVFWFLLVFGAGFAIIWLIVAAIRYAYREARSYREEVRQDREEGRPWLNTFIAWPGIIGNFAVLGFAALRYFDDECRALMRDCLQQIPFWWLPVSLLLLSIPILWLEKLVLSWRQRRR